MKNKKTIKVPKAIEDLQKEYKPCPRCYGYGWHPLGILSPIGRMDAYEWGTHVIKCPICGKGVVENERYHYLEEQFKEEIKKFKEGKDAKEKK